jgi:RNA recognition motif-containing protein
VLETSLAHLPDGVSISRILIKRKERKMDIYVGSLPYNITEEELKQAFQAFGNVESVNIVKDKFTGKSKGFGFVKMPSQEEAQAAVDGLNGKEFKGRTLTVNKARPKSEGRPAREGGGGRF